MKPAPDPDLVRTAKAGDEAAFEITIGGASAALTGLVFVALSLNVGVIAHDFQHTSRLRRALLRSRLTEKAADHGAECIPRGLR